MQSFLTVNFMCTEQALFLVLSDGCRLGRCFPEEHTLSDIVLLLNGLLIEKISEGAVLMPDDEMLVISEEMYRRLIDECRERYSKALIKHTER